MSIRLFTSEEKKNINQQACYPCAPGASFDLCRPIPSAGSHGECKAQCKDQYNAKAYFYDKNGTKYCYCGSTKASCEQYDYAKKNPCTEGATGPCVLVSGEVINKQPVPEVTNADQCQTTCNKILKSDGLYCDNNCICTDPSIAPVDLQTIIDLEKQYRLTCDDKNTLYCTDGTPIPTAKTSILPKSYFGYNNFLGKGISDNVKNAYCGCDKSVVAFYHAAFPDPNKRPTLGSIWVTAVKSVKSKDLITRKSELYSAFNNELLNQAGREDNPRMIDINKLKALSAYEMCRITNDKYPRDKIPDTPSPANDPEGWLKFHLGTDSNSGKYLNRGVKILVMAMLLHVLFRTIIPKRGNLRNSLIYAMFIPQQFLQGRPQDKAIVMGSAIIFMLAIMSLVYSLPRLTKQEMGIIGGFMGLFLLGAIFGFIKQNKYILMLGLGIPLTVIAAMVVAVERPKDKPLEPSKVGWAVSIISGIFFLILGTFGFIIKGTALGQMLMLSFALIPIVAAVAYVLHIKPQGYDEGKTILKYFIPSSFKTIPTSGFAISIYAVVIGAVLTRLKILGGFWVLGIILFLFVFIVAIAIPIYSPIMDKKIGEIYESHTAKIVYAILGGFAVVSLISGIMSRFPMGSAHFIPFIVSTMFGVLPLATFAIIINFAIANYSPSIELLFLVLYRISGFLVSNNPNSGIGKILLAAFGKRATDKWVLPFLPLVSHIVKAYYAVSGDNLPGYFTTTNATTGVTGVTNSDMWIS